MSLGWDDEEATLPNNALDRRSGRVNFTFVPRSDLRFEAGLAISNTESTFPAEAASVVDEYRALVPDIQAAVRRLADS